jgi:MinD superfamily P-loop ATPase
VKQISIISGKGGTGKTTVAACLALLSRPVVTADCDVDASNMALLLEGADGPEQAFFAGRRARVDPELCDGCGLCVSECRFDANHLDSELVARVNPLGCEGCGVCQIVCSQQAVTLQTNQAGVWMVRDSFAGPLVHARLGVAQDNSGKLVAKVREVARAEAQRLELELVLIDGPPGIGCPVHAAITGADLLLAVTEPTPSGVHDLERILRLASSFQLQTMILINKSDLSAGYVDRIHALAGRSGAQVAGQLPFDPEVPRLLARREAPLSLPSFADGLRSAWRAVQARLLEQRCQAAQGGV